jgi:hypothetical protein
VCGPASETAGLNWVEACAHGERCPCAIPSARRINREWGYFTASSRGAAAYAGLFIGAMSALGLSV